MTDSDKPETDENGHIITDKRLARFIDPDHPLHPDAQPEAKELDGPTEA